MYLSDLKNGSTIIVDSNIFVYHFSSRSKYNSACTDFLERIEEGDIVGITSTSIVMETTHRMMSLEAAILLPEVKTRDLIKYLKEHPDIVKKLINHQNIPHKIGLFNIEVIAPDFGTIKRSQQMKTRFGFLSNDALTLQIMEDHKVSNLASNDSDFEGVDFLTLYKPTPAVIKPQ